MVPTNCQIGFFDFLLSSYPVKELLQQRMNVLDPRMPYLLMCYVIYLYYYSYAYSVLFRFFFIYSCHLYILQNKFEPRRIKEQRRMDPIARFLDNVSFYRCQRDDVLQIWSERWCTRAVIKWQTDEKPKKNIGKVGHRKNCARYIENVNRTHRETRYKVLLAMYFVANILRSGKKAKPENKRLLWEKN